MSEINLELIFRNFTYYLKEKHKSNHYKDHIAKFAKETGIALNKNGLLDIKVTDYLPETDNPIEDSGAKNYDENGKNSPSTIISSNSIIIPNGEIFPDRYYVLNFGTGYSSVKTADKRDKNHKPYRSAVLEDIHKKCRLLNEFETGEKKLSHDELFGIATNLVMVETGVIYFTNIRTKHPELYDGDRNEKWKADLTYMIQNDYKPECCEKYCPYHEECSHSRNILTTVHTRRGSMEPIAGYREDFCSMEEMQEDVYSAIERALFSMDKKFYIIKAQVGAGKSYSYLKIMKEHRGRRFLVAAPTNLLKRELYEKAKELGIKVMVTPSLEEIGDEIPAETWDYIQKLYARGQSHLVHTYIRKTIEKEDIPCLKKYMKKRQKLKECKESSVITTHRYLLNMDKGRLDEFDFIIIDEDIIFKSIVSNQEQITVSELNKLKRKTSDCNLSDKIDKLLKLSRNQRCIEVEGFEWDKDKKIKKSVCFDVPAFCLAEKFYFRPSSEEENLDQDTFVFLKRADFPGEKYIMVSATADKDICRLFFGKNNVNFYECKKAENKGRLNQYPQRSMSRSSLAKQPHIVGKLMQKFGISKSHVITFMKENIGALHFGNTEGSNALEGENILVVGTPYHAEFIYKLTAFSVGVDFDEDEEMVLIDVVHNGYRFKFTAFQDEELRAIQFWMIESELEQAVGRARLLRHDCDVYLFSNFPLRQSKMVEEFDYAGI